MMELSQCLAKNGIKVTFVNTEFNHGRVLKAISVELEALIEKINGKPGDEITCVLADFYMAGALEVAEKFLVKRAAFLTDMFLKQDMIHSESSPTGTPLKNQMIQLSPSMPKMSTTYFAWTSIPDPTMRKIIFRAIFQNSKSEKLAQRLICNTSYELEAGALTFIPNCFPIGPLLAGRRLGKSSGYFWREDSTCLNWLDQHPENSVIYIAFGSFTIFDQIQFRELALGLELTNRPFLWVVREDIIQDIDEAYPEGFRERVKNRGKLANWAPQQEVLSHPSVACFLSHCGWNSTIECISSGTPLLCWPYFADQFLNQSYIEDYWEVGLGFEKDERGVIGREEIMNKVEKVIGDGRYKMRAVELQGKILDGVEGGGRSQKNFKNFVDWIKEN